MRCRVRYNSFAGAARLLRLPPPHRLTDPIGGAATLPAARGPLLIFRKIHLYGKTKKSTHGHRERNAATRGARRSREMRPYGRPRAGAPGRRCRDRRRASRRRAAERYRVGRVVQGRPRSTYPTPGLPYTAATPAAPLGRAGTGQRRRRLPRASASAAGQPSGAQPAVVLRRSGLGMGRTRVRRCAPRPVRKTGGSLAGRPSGGIGAG
jgi:hypothetical protein